MKNEFYFMILKKRVYLRLKKLLNLVFFEKRYVLREFFLTKNFWNEFSQKRLQKRRKEVIFGQQILVENYLKIQYFGDVLFYLVLRFKTLNFTFKSPFS